MIIAHVVVGKNTKNAVVNDKYFQPLLFFDSVKKSSLLVAKRSRMNLDDKFPS